MELTVENHEKYTKMSKKDLITEIVGICMHLIISIKMLDVWVNKKQLIMDLHRAICEEYTIKKFEKWELIIILFNEGRIICDIEYILEKKVDKVHKSYYMDDEGQWILPRDEVPSDCDVDTSDSGGEALKSLYTKYH